jgi:hypothetical protein
MVVASTTMLVVNTCTNAGLDVHAMQRPGPNYGQFVVAMVQ